LAGTGAGKRAHSRGEVTPGDGLVRGCRGYVGSPDGYEAAGTEPEFGARIRSEQFGETELGQSGGCARRDGRVPNLVARWTG